MNKNKQGRAEKQYVESSVQSARLPGLFLYKKVVAHEELDEAPTCQQ